METYTNHVGSLALNASERDLIAQAEKVLGGVPEWYWENRAELEQNRITMAEAAARYLAEIDAIVNKTEEKRGD